ncbi:hypothetical protein L1049_026870 [Liquidambar formosana]|uniref:non-specific serine/threonine protein kinase n=1 Tax=Liquidambar formosana TaxID=63359 RepID=A0AAP0NGA7_LIQFO
MCPAGITVRLQAGFRHACAISLNGRLDCWGPMVGKQPQGEFISLALGENRSCGLQRNETVACWGDNNFDVPESLRETKFIAIEAKRSIFCGIELRNYSLFCWGHEIFDSNFMVFKNVLPGSCRSKCPCRPLPYSGHFCEQGDICLPCEPVPSGETPPITMPSPPPAPPPPQEGFTRWNRKMVAFFVVGCVGSLSLLIVVCFFLFRYCSGRVCRVHDSGPLDDPELERGSSQRRQVPQAQPAAPRPVLEKRLSQLVSLGGNGRHLEEFSLQVLLEATREFLGGSQDRNRQLWLSVPCQTRRRARSGY